ncbi:MAG: AmmeMemoRadiSam system radical SAM enzyme [Planctomycetes bacterium]|nr:AmmeMemoRadiSam system radical SAM enzyme [Planctomycetota bacterium]
MHEAILYERAGKNRVQCRLCRHGCLIEPGGRGLCGVRENQQGTLYTLVYDRVAATGIDPIEKKPFFHFYPAGLAYSLATMGCNFTCSHCQNCHLSQTPSDVGEISGKPLSPQAMVDNALAEGCRSISYTYSEPTVFAELVLDTSRLAHDAGLFNTWVTNGYASPELIEKFNGLIDAANIDLKAWSMDFYKTVCRARLEGVLDTIQRMHAQGIWIEITTLLIPGLNDSDQDLKCLAKFIADLDRNIPWHISRYHPAYRMNDRPVTSIRALEKALEIGSAAGLNYVYAGNVPGNEGENTRCPGCGKRVIHRYGFTVRDMAMKENRCLHCGAEIAGRFINISDAR